MEYSGWLTFLLIGAIAGWLSGVLLKGRGFGLLGNIVVGIVGAYIGNFVLSEFGVFFSGILGTIVTAIIGAAILLFIVGLLKKDVRLMTEYIEIKKLKTLINKHEIKIERITFDSDDFFKVRLISTRRLWEIYIDDEYHDYDEGNQVLCFYLTLRSLEDYNDTENIENWCKLYDLDSSEEKWGHYFKELSLNYQEIDNLFSGIDSFIADLDYQLRSDVFYKLKNL